MADDSTSQPEEETPTETETDQSVLEMFEQHGEQDDIAWSWNEEDDVDPQLVDMAGPPQSSILRPILMLTVLVMGAMVIKDRQTDLAYFFSETTPIEVGKVLDFAEKRATDPTFKPNIKHNRYVSLEGIPSKRSINERFRYTKLVGGDIYVEIPREDNHKSTLEKVMDDKPKGTSDRAYFSGAGRALKFSEIPERYRNLRIYYRRHYNTTFCVDLTQEQQAQRLSDRKAAFQSAWKKRYDQASEQERTAKKLTQQPTQAQIDQMTKRDPLCTQGYIIQAGVTPRSHWWYVLLCGVIALFMVIDTFFLIKWIKNFLTPDDL